MARLEDDQNHGLPPPPAATRRGANPWTLSETARMPEHGPASMSPDPLAEWMQKAPVANTHAEARGPD
jgi:hypothetical protein